MRYVISQFSSIAAARTILAVAATLALASACDRSDQLPTGPSITARLKPQATIVGATVTVLPTLGGTLTHAMDINDAGQVVGSSYTAGNAEGHAFLWTSAGGMQDLGTLGGTTSYALAINNGGQVVGSSYRAGSFVERAVLWSPGQPVQELGTLGGPSSTARGINDKGQVVGYATTALGSTHAFLWTPGLGMQDLGTLGGTWSYAYDINNAGQIVGYGQTSGGPTHPFLWTPGGGMRDLGSLGGPHSAAFAINEIGHVVGFSVPLGSDWPHPFRWEASEGIRDLGTFGGDSPSEATDVNDAGLVVGYSTLPGGGPVRAFVWTLADGLQDIYPVTGMSIPAAINNRGQVVAHDRVGTLQFAEPSGTFITGSGFYTVPDRARRKAHFTFTVRFLPGRAAVPNGAAKFWVPGGQVDFQSTLIEMLVFSGTRVQFSGTGTLNGAAARFRVTAVDGQSSGSGGPVDAFRIEIWQAGTTVFDTQPGASPDAAVTTAIEAGNIQIHRE